VAGRAYDTLEPRPTSEELRHAADVVRALVRERGYPSMAAAAQDAGLGRDEFSRFLGPRRRYTGFWRLARIALWAGVSVDVLLGRPEGTTWLALGGGKRIRPEEAVVAFHELLGLSTKGVDK
jgi:hypothetical protein